MPENLISKEQQKNYLRNLSENPGWKVLEYRINEQLDILKGQLENDSNVDTKANQNQIKSYKLILRWVSESKGRKKNAS